MQILTYCYSQAAYTNTGDKVANVLCVIDCPKYKRNRNDDDQLLLDSLSNRT